MGVMGMGYDDFCRLTPEEFEECCKARHEAEENRNRLEWERMRMLATITVQPHTKKRLSPKKLLPFPWDSEERQKKQLPPKEKQLERFQKLMKNYG